MDNTYRRQRVTGTLGKIDEKATNYRNRLSVLFDGVDAYVNLGNPANLSFERTNAFSISCWLKTTTNALCFPISKLESAGTGRGWGMRLTNGNVYFNLANTTSTSHLQVRTTSATVNSGNWQHAVITYSGNSDVSGVTIYVDNSSAALTTIVNTLNATTINSINAQLSGRNGTDSVYPGNEDEVSVWNKELTSGEVSEIWNGGQPNNLLDHSVSNNLVSWWRMGDGDTFPVLFDSQSTNDGTMLNMLPGDIVSDVP
jgi:hypothetical protein